MSALIRRIDASLQCLCASYFADLKLADFESELTYSILLTTLPEELANFRSALLIQQGDAITYEKVKQACLQEEQARAASASGAVMRATEQANQDKAKQCGKRQGSKPSFTPCNYQMCKHQSSHPIERCYAKQHDEHATKVKELEEKLAKAKEASTQPVKSAGEASVFDVTDPRSPLITDARTD